MRTLQVGDNPTRLAQAIAEFGRIDTLYQHADDPEGPGAAALARTADTTRLRRADPADMGAGIQGQIPDRLGS